MTRLDLPQDYRDLLAAFADADVEFVIVGGWAVAACGHGRVTDDLHVFVVQNPRGSHAQPSPRRQ